jgi:hypothetical protein
MNLLWDSKEADPFGPRIMFISNIHCFFSFLTKWQYFTIFWNIWSSSGKFHHISKLVPILHSSKEFLKQWTFLFLKTQKSIAIIVFSIYDISSLSSIFNHLLLSYYIIFIHISSSSSVFHPHPYFVSFQTSYPFCLWTNKFSNCQHSCFSWRKNSLQIFSFHHLWYFITFFNILWSCGMYHLLTYIFFFLYTSSSQIFRHLLTYFIIFQKILSILLVNKEILKLSTFSFLME